MSDAAATLTIIALAFGLIGAAYATWRRFHPAVQRASAALDAIIGKPAITDRGGQIMEPAQPGLVHRVATVEEAVVEFRHMVGLLTETQHAITNLDSRVKSLEDGRLEKLVSHAEAAQMWRAVADNAVNDGD